MPSSPDFRTPAAGNSNAPNIRAALFTLPIVRLTYAELGLRGYNSMPTGAAAHSVPGTPLADARLVPTVRASTTTGIPRSIATATPRTATPMCKTPPIPPLSRGDFSAQVLHYRLRGANSVNLFGGASVVGYGAAAAQEDIRAGWSASSRVNEIFASGGDRGGLPEDRGLHARD